MSDPTQQPRLSIVLTSTREGRVGAPVADWFADRARAHGGFAVELIDLREVGLPLLDEPNHPTKRQYTKPHTMAWSARVAAADAFVFVVPEYNYGMPPSLLNALDFLYHEWAYKAVAFVSYGGASGGLRSVQMAKQVVTTLRMMPIPEGVSFPHFARLIDAAGKFEPGEAPIKAAQSLLDELARWTGALKTLRS